MKAIALSLIIYIAGCATFSRSTLSRARRIQPGQSRAAVLETLGAPAEIRKVSPEKEVWAYEIYSDDSSRTYPYTALFAGETLVSFQADSSRAQADQELCRKRRHSDQGLIDYANNAPTLSSGPCSGTDPEKGEVNEEALKSIQRPEGH